jgi:hypothetical protein
MTNRQAVEAVVEQMSNFDGASAGVIKSLLKNFEQQLIDAIEDLSYEFIDAPNEDLAPDDDPAYDFAEEVQGVFLSKIIAENFPRLVWNETHNMYYDEQLQG